MYRSILLLLLAAVSISSCQSNRNSELAARILADEYLHKVGQLVPWMHENATPAGTFFMFSLFCIPVPFVLRRIPGTKGMSLYEIEKVWR